MKRFELVCIDMFQTLVDVDTRIPFIWKRILEDNYNELLKNRCEELVRTKVINRFHEQVSTYKEFLNLKTLFLPCFQDISNEIKVRFNPEKVIHIGDASSDIIGANKFGITTCWINRNNREWIYKVQPDYIVKSLSEVNDILGFATKDKVI